MQPGIFVLPLLKNADSAIPNNKAPKNLYSKGLRWMGVSHFGCWFYQCAFVSDTIKTRLKQELKDRPSNGQYAIGKP